MEKIRLGLVGCGNIMVRAHAQAMDACKEPVEVTAVCDVIYDRAADAAKVLGDPFVCTDYRQMLDYVDAVLIALPHDLHYECGLFFAHNKKHIMMEKPLCNTEEECLSLIQACDENKVTLMCAYPVRYWPGIVKLKELVDSGSGHSPAGRTSLHHGTAEPWAPTVMWQRRQTWWKSIRLSVDGCGFLFGMRKCDRQK